MSEGVVPTILVERTVFWCANRVFPLITSLEVGTLDDTTAREAEYTRVKVFEVFYQVGTQAIPVVGREHRNMIEVYALVAFEEDAHIALLQGLLGCELNAILLPLVVGDGDRLALHRIVVFIHELNSNLSLLAIEEMQTTIDAEIIFHALFQSHAEEATVFESGRFFAMTRWFENNIVRVAVESRLYAAYRNIAPHVPAHEAVREFERAVFYHLCIKSAIGSEVDVFEEYAIHGRLYRRSWLGGDVELALCRCRRCQQGRECHRR